MRVSKLIEALQDLPPDYTVDLARLVAVKEDQGYEVILHAPVLGLARDDEQQAIRLVVDAGPHLLKYGEVVPLVITLVT